MRTGIRRGKPGARLGDIGHSIQRLAESRNYSVVREYCGHGIGRKFHEDPQVLHYGKPGTGAVLQQGMTFTIEPMINAGKRHTKLSKRPLDRGHQGSQPVSSVGTHPSGYR